VKLIVTLFAAVVLMVSSAFAQSGAIAPYVDAGIGISSSVTGTGSVTASNPNYFVGVGVESSTKHLLLDVNGQFSTANFYNFKISEIKTNTYAARVQGTGYLKLGKLLVGGGALYNNVVVDGNISSLIPQRNTFVPLVGGGFQFSRDRITALYELPGRSATGARNFDIHNEIFVGKSAHLRLTQDVNIASNLNGGLVLDGVNTRVTGASASAGVKFVF
jgi:hypothetical protein